MMLLEGPRVLLDTLAGLFFPPHCAACDVSLEEGWLCGNCRQDIQPVGRPCCESCSRPFDGQLDSVICPNCEGRQFHFDFAVSVVRSRGVVRDLVHRLKYGGESWLGARLGEILAEGMLDKRTAGRHFDALIPVPLHSVRQRDRMFNQSELLAASLGKRVNLPVTKALRRMHNTVTQTHFDRRHRMQNLRDAFLVRQNVPVDGKNLLLIDDVFTTGSTLDECARVLREAGASSVCALTLARG